MVIRKVVKNIGRNIVELININTTRELNNKKIQVPIINGVKVGVGGEKWMSGILQELFKYLTGSFYDVGINLGQTLIKIKTLDAERKYIGFEPNPSCLFYLQRLIIANNWMSCTVVPVGLLNIDCLLELVGKNDTDAGSTIISTIKDFRHKKNQNHRRYFTKFVPLFHYETLKNYLPKEEIVSIIKIDVEGAELEVIRSLYSLIKKDRPVIIMEILPIQKKNHTKEIEKILKGIKYIFYRIIKTPKDTYGGLSLVENIGDYSNIILKDHLIVPVEKKKQLQGVLSNFTNNI